jgi:hypothetical protein
VIRLQAERRAGELLAQREKAKGGEQSPKTTSSDLLPVQTLAADRITKTQSSRAQRLAALSEEKLEVRVEHAKARVEGVRSS